MSLYPHIFYSTNICEILLQPAVSCYNSWANLWGSGCLPLGEKIIVKQVYWLASPFCDWPKYRLGWPSSPLHYGFTWPVGIPTDFQTPGTVPLHNPTAGKCLPLGLCKGNVKESNSFTICFCKSLGSLCNRIRHVWMGHKGDPSFSQRTVNMCAQFRRFGINRMNIIHIFQQTLIDNILLDSVEKIGSHYFTIFDTFVN